MGVLGKRGNKVPNLNHFLGTIEKLMSIKHRGEKTEYEEIEPFGVSAWGRREERFRSKRETGG